MILRLSAIRSALNAIRFLHFFAEFAKFLHFFPKNGYNTECINNMPIGEHNMKTEISVPNPIFKAAERLATALGMSLSEFYVAALTAYVATYQNGDVAKRLDEVYAKEPSTMEPEMVAIQIAAIGEEKW